MKPARAEPVRLFVYGTLMRGHAAHRLLCRNLRSAAPATIRGRLLLHPDGYPVAAVNPADAVSLAGGPIRSARRTGAGGASRIHGELLCLVLDDEDLARLDAYEGCVPGRSSLFARVRLPVRLDRGRRSLSAWTYVAGCSMPLARLPPLTDGRWRAAGR